VVYLLLGMPAVLLWGCQSVALAAWMSMQPPPATRDWNSVANLWVTVMADAAALGVGATVWLVRDSRARKRGDVCGVCGYSRAGLGQAPCPECGVESGRTE